jgi:hypothetical protein
MTVNGTGLGLDAEVSVDGASCEVLTATGSNLTCRTSAYLSTYSVI